MTPLEKSRQIDLYNEEFMEASMVDQSKPYERYFNRVIGEVFKREEPTKKEVNNIIKETSIKSDVFKVQVYSSLVLSGVTNVIEKQNLDKEDKDLLTPIIAIMGFYSYRKKLIARKTQILSRAIATGNTRNLNSRDKKILPIYKQYFSRNKETLNIMMKQAEKQINFANKQIKSSLSKSIRNDLTKEVNKKVTDRIVRNGRTETVIRKQTYKEIRQNMIDKYGEQVGKRVDRIVNTEVKQLIESTKIQHHSIMGYTHKKWNTQLDKRVRESHRNLQGKVIPIDKKFRVGGSWAMYPSDTNLPLKETINERCYLTYTKR